MPTTVLASALPYSLADGAPFHLTIFITHKLVGDGVQLADYPAAADWVGTLSGCTLGLRTSVNPGLALPLRAVSVADAGSWVAVLPPATAVAPFPTPAPSAAPWVSNPASRMGDHAIDLHLAAITAAPLHRPGLAGDPVAGGLLRTLATMDQGGPLWRLLDDEAGRARRAFSIPGKRLREALATIGPLTEPQDSAGRQEALDPLPPYASEITDQPSPLQILLEDPDADLRVTARLDALMGQDLSADPQLQMMVDAHAMRRYYERPEQPQPEPRAEPDPNAAPTPRPERPQHDFHAKAASFGATPALLRRLGLAIDVVLDGVDAAGARAALAGATWVSVELTSTDADLQILPARRTAVFVEGDVFTALSSTEWVGGALPLGEEYWVVLDADPDASGLKLDQHVRNLGRQYASEANGDPATGAPGTVRATGFAIARRDRAAQVRTRVQAAQSLAADDDSRELLLDDLVRGIRIEVWDSVTQAWHSLHRRTVNVTAQPGAVPVLADTPDVGFLQLSALNRAPGDPLERYYLHEVVAGWDGWSLSAPRPGLTIVHLEPPAPDGSTEAVVAEPPDPPLDGAHITSRVEPGSLPRLRYGTSYSFRVLAVDLAGNSVPAQPPGVPAPGAPDGPALAAAATHLAALRARYGERDGAGLAAASRAAVLEQHSDAPPSPEVLPPEMLSGDGRIDAVLAQLVGQAVTAVEVSGTQRAFDGVRAGAKLLAGSARTPRVRPQLRTSPTEFAALARNDDLQLAPAQRLAFRPMVTAPRPYLRWEPIPAPALVPRQELGTGEQPSVLVVRSGARPDEPLPDVRDTAERHIAAPKATQLEAEAAGSFDAAIGTGDAAQIRRLYAVALAERGTFLDQYAPSLSDANAVDEQPGIALVDRPGADIASAHRATLAEITAERGRPIGEGQYVVHDTDALTLPYLPDPYASGVSLVFFEAGPPHALSEPRALQAISVPYPGQWPALAPLRIILERGDVLDARVVGHEIHVSLPPGEQVRVALSSTLDTAALEKFGLWRSHLASVADPADGYTTDEVVAAAALMRAASSGWMWWLTPSVQARLVHAVPAPVRPPVLRALEVFLRPPGRSVVALTGLVDVHGPSTDTLLVRARWSETVDDPAAPVPQVVDKSDVVVRSAVGAGERTGVLFLYDFQPTGPLAAALGGVGFHKMIQTFPDTHHRQVSYVPSGTTRYAEYFTALPDPADPLLAGEPVVVDIPSSARPAAPILLDAVPLLRWEETAEPQDPFGWRRVRRSGVRLWLGRPWFSSGDGELLGVLLFDTAEWVQQPDGSWQSHPKAVQAPDSATSLWAADPIATKGGPTWTPTIPPLLTLSQLLLDVMETASAEGVGISPPLTGRAQGGRDRGWPHGPGNPVAVAAAIPLHNVAGQPAARVLGYQPEFDQESGRWFVDIAFQQTPALWPFVRLAVARYQPHSIPGSELSPVALAGWVQPLPTRTLTVTRPDDGHVQLTLSGVVNWLRWKPEWAPEFPGELLNADTPTGEDATRASGLRQSRTVHATVQSLAVGAGDLQWQVVSGAELLAVSVEESGGFRATWSGSVALPSGAGSPGLRRPGGAQTQWRVLVEEHELLDGDPTLPGAGPTQVPRLVYADTVAL
ncbi:hypothetical protein AOC05_06115 [Arthrobacter alpinus]|uniref:Uncharacterized protein n=1 Tax=Arthrobacter alpinus TaxID=656366 RepID=A0A0M4RN64_9MICC|nr:hypothetical protein [Arthrobacter alpinus]ALE92008.1 hypothetical protein AOC05_06115 [Arthrobacter alpinus]